jgi:hypothetical protein
VKNVTYLSVAELEQSEAVEYYESKEPGLGRIFLDGVRDALVTIQRDPEMWAYYGKPVRSYRVQPFPFRLIYRELPDRIQIVAVMNLHKRPGYWRKRI